MTCRWPGQGSKEIDADNVRHRHEDRLHERDDVFYEARGTTWALIHMLNAVEHRLSPMFCKTKMRGSASSRSFVNSSPRRNPCGARSS
ncbi:MAG: DUF2333 family protein [Gammaproteobacteria bacterium]|nr:DUF2333 family protein [Gammaproteobacteria bacterium]